MEVLTEIDPERIARLHEADEFFWLDLVNPAEADLQTLREILDLHEAALEDTREWEQIPKIDDYADHVTLVFYSARLIDDIIEPVECHVYVAGGWMLTFRREACPLDPLHEKLAGADGQSEDESLYYVLNALADGWDPAIDQLDARVDDVETAVLERPQQRHLTTIYRLKQETHRIARLAQRQRDLMHSAVEVLHAVEGLELSSREWLRDVATHMDGIADDVNRLSEDLLALTSTFFNASAYRLNRLATFITVGSVFFLVWTLVTSFFGQNFKWMTDHIASKSNFLTLGVGGLVVPTVVLVVLFVVRRKDWL